MKINVTVYELWFWRISIPLLLLICAFLYQSRPLNTETTKIFYATFTPEGELKIENPPINKSMGCNIYWRAKGYPCFDIK
jgi:hypothetical protein